MDRGSFDVDHLVLKRGVYLSRCDALSDTLILTFDLRLRRPYEEQALSCCELHTFEHCYATAVRKHLDGGIIMPVYIGPMGCATGFYAVVAVRISDFADTDEAVCACMAELHRASIDVLSMAEVPAAVPRECGNCNTLGDIGTAHSVARDLNEIFSRVERNGYCPDEYVYIVNS